MLKIMDDLDFSVAVYETWDYSAIVSSTFRGRQIGG